MLVIKSGYIEAIEPPEGPVDVEAEDIKVDGLANNSFFISLAFCKKKIAYVPRGPFFCTDCGL